MSRQELQAGGIREAVNHIMGRELSAATIMFHSAIAERLGLSTTDHKALDFIYRHAPLAAGQLAELTGLTTAAITGVVDRLEKAEFVKRKADPNDRRKVLIVPNPARQQDVYRLFSSLSKAIAELTSSYDDKELVLIYEFVTKATEILREQTRNLRQT